VFLVFVLVLLHWHGHEQYFCRAPGGRGCARSVSGPFVWRCLNAESVFPPTASHLLYVCLFPTFFPSLNRYLQFVGVLMSFMLLGVSIVQLCLSILTVLRSVAILTRPSERHLSRFLPAMGPMVHPRTRYVFSIRCEKSVMNLRVDSVLRFCPGPRAECGGRWARLRGDVQWCLGLVHRRRPHCLRHAYVPHTLLPKFKPHAFSRSCMPKLLRLAHLPVWRLGNHAHHHSLCVYPYHVFISRNVLTASSLRLHNSQPATRLVSGWDIIIWYFSVDSSPA
jgi:hypothetical protein